MAILETEVEVRWNGSNKRYYVDRGHEYTKLNDYFKVSINELQYSSNLIITCICDKCYEEKKVKFSHYTISVTFKKFGFGAYYCKTCAIEIHQRKDKDVFSNDFKTILGDEYTLLSEYEKNQVSILVCHNTCGHQYYVKPNHILLVGTRCPKCSGLMRKTIDQFKIEVSTIHGDEYEILGEYINTSTKIKCVHHTCGTEYYVIPNDILHGSKCPTCFGTPQKTTEQYINEVFNLVGEEYAVLGEYLGASKKILMMHIKCSYTYKVNPSVFIHCGTRCPKCSGLMRKTSQIFSEEVFNLVGDEYTVIGEYINSAKKLKMIHVKCNTTYDVTPNSFLSGNRCPNCSASKGENKVQEYLTLNLLRYEREYKIQNCRYKRVLPFDFAIFDDSEFPALLVEFDGAQHEKPIDFFGGEKTFKSLVKRDEIKTNYCIVNNIPLIRISYRDFDNIEEILTNELIKLNIKNAI